MSTPPSSIEEVAKRVKRGQALRTGSRTVDASINAKMADAAPQLAEWVEKALPVIEAARHGVSDSYNPFGDPRTASVLLPRSIFNELRDGIAALDTPSSLAAEGTTE